MKSERNTSFPAILGTLVLVAVVLLGTWKFWELFIRYVVSH